MSLKALELPVFLLLLGLLSGCNESAPADRQATPTGSATAVPPADTQLASLRGQLQALQVRKQRIEDSNAIKRLQRAFGYYMDEALWDEIAALFADTATLEFGRDGVYGGKDRIREYLYALNNGRQGLSDGQLHEHMQLMPVVTLAADGNTAKARWKTLMMLGQLGENALWGEGPYENEYVKEDGVWKISRLRWFQSILVPYDGGWAKHEDFNHGIWVSDTLPPDAPPSDPYGWWPETFLPPFSFENPVGRYVPEAAQAASATSATAAPGAQP